jgi:hypothetical protein
VDPRIREAIHKQDFDSSLEDFARSAPPRGPAPPIASRCDGRGASAQWLAGCRKGNRLYLDKLSRVAESPDAKQCAGRVVVAETTDNFIPGRS